MTRNLFAFILAASFALGGPAFADGIENAGTIIAVALPITAAGISGFKDDWVGVEQVTLVTGFTLGTAYGLKHIIREERPDRSDMKSFPSDTAALAFAPASYLWDRYGWRYGLPAYAAATFVAYSRVDTDKHHWWDVAASAGLAFGFSKLITREYQGGFYSAAYATPESAYVRAGYRW